MPLEQTPRREKEPGDTPLEYSTVGGITSQAADLKGGGLRYEAGVRSQESE